MPPKTKKLSCSRSEGMHVTCVLVTLKPVKMLYSVLALAKHLRTDTAWSYHQALQTASGHFFSLRMPLLQAEGYISKSTISFMFGSTSIPCAT